MIDLHDPIAVCRSLGNLLHFFYSVAPVISLVFLALRISR